MSKSHSIFTALFVGLAYTGCAPMLPIGGAYFPDWLLSGLGGLLVVSVVRALLIALDLDRHLQPRVLAYPAMTVLFTLLIFLLFFP